jgi:hypothetical protein
MLMKFVDSAKLGEIRTTADGYKVAEVPVARTGIQDYVGREVGRPDMPIVRLYRPPDAVFADGYLASMAHKPVTNDHPPEAVTSANWSKYAKGQTGDTIRKDEAAGLVYVPMMFADQSTIDDLEAGKREVSVGYTCNIKWESGTTPDGQLFDAVQIPDKVNHVALVTRGRAGYSCRVGDAWEPIVDNKEPLVATKTITFDGLPVEVTDAAEAVINVLKGRVSDAEGKVTAADAKVVERDASIVAKDAEIAKLKKDVADAALTPAKLRDAAKVYAVTMAKAKALGATVTDSTSEADAHKMVVDAAMGDTAKDYTADQYALAFNVLAKDAKVEVADPLREAIRDNQPPAEGRVMADNAYEAFKQSLENGYKQKVDA